MNLRSFSFTRGIAGKAQAIFSAVFLLVLVVLGLILYITQERSLMDRSRTELANASGLILDLVDIYVDKAIQNYLRATAEKARDLAAYHYKLHKWGALSEADAYLRAKTVILDPVFGRIGETGLKRLLQFEADFVVAGEASNGLQAVELSRTLSPDLVIMDIDMPLMNGLEATRRIMADHPLPILIFSNDAGPDTAYEAMASGAIEAMQKPDMDRFNEPAFYAHFLKKLRSLAEARPHPRRSAASDRSAGGGRDRFRLLVMGASTGGPAAVREILSKLPAGFPLPIAQVQHMETGFDAGYVRWLGDGSALPVRLAEREVAMEPGVVWAAPVDRHIRIDRSAARPTLILDDGAKVLNQRPSVDVLFTSAAEAFGDRLAGILLTGMGRDGARGCLSIVEKRGITLVQDEATSAIFGMPKSAIELGGASRVLPLPEIPGAVQSLLIPAARKEGDR